MSKFLQELLNLNEGLYGPGDRTHQKMVARRRAETLRNDALDKIRELKQKINDMYDALENKPDDQELKNKIARFEARLTKLDRETP